HGIIGTGVGPGLLFWIVPALAAVLMWWEDRLTVSYRVLLTALFLCSCAAVGIGFYFRLHYFLLLLPALSLLIGIAVSRGFYWLKHDRTIELFLALPILGLFFISLATLIVSEGPLWFAMSPVQTVRETYSTTIYSEARRAAEFIRANTSPRDKIAVIGSKPEIYFYSHRHSSTGYVYTYPLLETHPYALKMQQQMIAEIEHSPPEYVVYVDDDLSWLRRANSQTE